MTFNLMVNRKGTYTSNRDVLNKMPISLGWRDEYCQWCNVLKQNIYLLWPRWEAEADIFVALVAIVERDISAAVRMMCLSKLFYSTT